MKLGNITGDSGDKSITGREKIKNLLHRSYLKRWMGQLTSEDALNDAEGYVATKRQNYPLDYARSVLLGICIFFQLWLAWKVTSMQKLINTLFISS